MVAAAPNLCLFGMAEVRAATQNFSHIVGRGAFGVVYRGELGDGEARRLVAVKKLNGLGTTASELLSELTTAASVQSERVLAAIGVVRCPQCCRPQAPSAYHPVS